MIMIPSTLGWTAERPRDTFTINQRFDNNNSDGRASVGLGVHIGEFLQSGTTCSSSADCFQTYIVATANTRKGITYDLVESPTWPACYQWLDVTNVLSIPADDGYGVINASQFLPYVSYVRLYGGPLSANYQLIYISRNGFLTFDSGHSDPTYPYAIPDVRGPNGFIAPFWKDLKPGGEIRYGVATRNCDTGGGWTPNILVISWIDVPDASGELQTFQVLINGGQDMDSSRIYFQYKSVTTSIRTVIGIEDQEGFKGTGYDYHRMVNQKVLLFRAKDNALSLDPGFASIESLNIKIAKNGDANSYVNLVDDDAYRRGFNVVLKSPEPDYTHKFATALGLNAGGVALPLMLGGKAGLIVSLIFVTAELILTASEKFSPAQPYELVDDDAGIRDVSNFKAQTPTLDPYGLVKPVDAMLGILLIWSLTDPNTQDSHSLAVTAELTYQRRDGSGFTYGNPITIATSQTISVNSDHNGDMANAAPILTGTSQDLYLGPSDTLDYYSFYTVSGPGQRISVTLTPPATANFDLYLYNPSGVLMASSTSGGTGGTESLTSVADSTGTWYILASYIAGNGYYSLSLSVWSTFSCTATASPTVGSHGYVTPTFTASCSGGSPPYGYYWQFNDGSGATSTQNPTSHTYSCLPGVCGATYYPTLRVTDAVGVVVNPPVPAITVYCRNACPEKPTP